MNSSPLKDVEDARTHIKKVNEWLDYLKDNGLKYPEKYIADQVISFETGYGRIGIIWIGKEDCVSCKTVKQCLIVDQSEGEYLQGVICFDCINILRKANI